MKLFYRGLEHSYNPSTVVMEDGKVGGKFRGSNWRFHTVKEQPVAQPHLSHLTYRGVDYQ